MEINFGRTASDYSQHRAGFPEQFFERIQTLGFIPTGTRLLDLGTGTGSVARGMALRGCETIGLDISTDLIDKSRELDKQAGVEVDYKIASAEDTGFADNSFGVVTAGQCWHWFDGDKTAQEVKRILVPNGYLIIAHFDWIPLADNIVAQTEALILKYNPAWHMGGRNGFYPQWLIHMGQAGFTDIETFSFDLDVVYSHEAWRGRIRASAGVGASLDESEIEKFDKEHQQMLMDLFPQDPLHVPHRVFVVMGKKT